MRRRVAVRLAAIDTRLHTPVLTRPLRALARSGLAGALLCALALGGCGSASTRSASTHATHRAAARARGSETAHARPHPARLAYHPLYSLPAPLRDPASAALGGGRFALLGGLDAADVSTAGIEIAGPHGVLQTATLSLAQHDAQAARINGIVYVFGGGSFSELDHIIGFDPAHRTVSTVGTLPQAQSDVAVTESDGTAYVFGGFDGTSWLSTILAWRPGSAVRVVGHLPVGLRYAAASAVNGRILIIGGSTPTGASRAVYEFDPATRGVRQIGHLPQPITHASAATLGSFVYLVGGRGDNLDSQTARVWSIDPRSGAVSPAGRLPQPLSDTGVLSTGGKIIVAGGQSPTSTAAAVGELLPSASR